jgi:hypothetical protein
MLLAERCAREYAYEKIGTSGDPYASGKNLGCEDEQRWLAPMSEQFSGLSALSVRC